MRTALILTLCIGVLAIAAFVTTRHIDKRAQPFRELSKMMSVRLVIAEALSSHYQKHGRYPGSISELPLQTLHWGDEGSSARDVDAWSYVSDGSSFTMSWTNASGQDLFLGGKTGQVYYSQDGRQ
jgi:hypothetical protein